MTWPNDDLYGHLPEAERCPECGQPDNCGDCDHTPIEPLECLDDHGEGTCAGPVEYRMALSPSGRQFPRCDRHWQERLDEQERINERYPDSPCPPADFDPLYAGERWDEE